jgi:hypothetical protein
MGVPARQLAQQPRQAAAAAQEQEAVALAAHVRPGHAPWCACLPDAAAALAASEGQEPGPRGRRPRLGRSHAVRSHRGAAPRRPRRAQRGRPAQLAPPPRASGSRLGVEVEALAQAAEAKGWTGLATTGDATGCPEADLLQAYQDPTTLVAPGLRWSKPPAASAPVWRENPERMAA